jgi:hypothetical protein
MMRKFAVAGLLFAALHGAWGQLELAGLTGTVRDAAGARVVGARVVAVQVATGLSRETVTSPNGSYTLPDLPIGVYRVTCTAPGFAEGVFSGIAETIGRTRTLDVALSVAASSTQVEVADDTGLDRGSDTQGALTAPKQIHDLPLNGRNWSTLTALVAGAVDTGGSNQRSIRFAGHGLDDNNYTLDGIDATNIVNQAQQPFVRLAIPLDAIEEFHVATMLFTAADGSTPGGQIAVASKAGSNQYHGSLFEFVRNSIFDAREPVDGLNGSKPPFRLNQFGGRVGGPIARDRMFFFLAYEGLRQSLSQTLLGYVPSAAFRATVAAQSPALLPVLNAFPAGTLPYAGNANISTFLGEGQQIDNENSAELRVDRRFSDKNSAFLRFNFDAAVSDAPFEGGTSYLADKQEITSRPVNGELEYLHIVSPRLLNETKFGFNRGTVFTSNRATLGLPTSVAVSGLTTLNNDEFKTGVGNSFSSIDNVTLVRAKHTLRFGVEVRRIQLNQGNTENGTVTYASLATFAANQVSAATLADALPVNGLRKTEVYSFAQDEWKVTPSLTLNLGLRYIFYNLFHEVHGKAIPFDFATCGAQGFCGAGASFGTKNLLDFDPRVAFAWAPVAYGGKTVVRGGFGLYHGDGQLDDQNLPISNEVAQSSLSASGTPGLAFPIAPFLNGPGTVTAKDDDRRRKDSYLTEWGISIQQALPHGFLNTLSYAGTKGTYLLTTSYVNLKDPVTGLRPYPAFGQVQWRGNINNSSYQALVENLQRNLSHGFLFTLNYTWSHDIDQDAAGGGDADYPENPACLPCERASGDYDVRSVFTSNVVYEVPFRAANGDGLARKAAAALLSRWTISPIVTMRTGLPINVTEDRSSSSVATGYSTNQRPNLNPGVSLVPPGGRGITHWINPAAFSLVATSGYGDAPRNIARGPGLWQADMALSKAIPVTERVQLNLRGDFFNLFNRAQYANPLSDFSTGTFGQITTTVNTGPVGTGTPRQMQFALRAEF